MPTGFDVLTIYQAAHGDAHGDAHGAGQGGAGHGPNQKREKKVVYLGVTAGGTPCSPICEETDDEKVQSQSSQSRRPVTVRTWPRTHARSDERLIAVALLDGRLKRADLKEDLDPWLRAQRTFLGALDDLSGAAEVMPADAAARVQSAIRNMDKITNAEMALEKEEEKLMRRHIRSS